MDDVSSYAAPEGKLMLLNVEVRVQNFVGGFYTKDY
jgi:hypothetical protein